jgi:hypothetical protein
VALPRTGRAGTHPEGASVRNSDRWITPGVVMVALLTGGALVALLLVVVGYLAARGVDPDPMLKTVGALATGAGSLATLVVTLATRQTTAKTERNTGRLAGAVDAVADALSAPPPAPPTQMAARPAVPPVRSRHAYPETGAAPAVRE